MQQKKSKLNRRNFLGTTGAAMAAGAFAHPAIGAAKGANEKLNIAILGPGGRAQEHIRILKHIKDETKLVDIVGLCDVWDGNDVAKRGLYYSAKKCGLDAEGKDKDRITKDYRKILENKDIDLVLIATPDHWHAKMSIDAMEAGKDVYCEKPMTHTIDEARRVAETVKKTGRVFTVGVQSTADPRWRMANSMIVDGKIGKVMQGQTSYYRNSDVGQWRYYDLTKDMTPKTVDWKMFLGTEFGLAPDQPFDRARYAQWRCYWDFGGGMYTDLFVHQLTHLIMAMGVRFPRRVVGAGGLYMEYDGRDVPDVATVVADYDEGCQVLISATMCNDTQLPEVIRGHNATITFNRTPEKGFNVSQQRLASHPAPPGSNTGEGGELFNPQQPREDTRALWEHFLGCVRSSNQETLCPADLGYAAITTVNLGVQSYREGKAYFFDKETGAVSPADTSWAAHWEKVSHDRGKPTQVMGWKAGETGSLLVPPAYQKLEGPWVDGKDPAEKA
ncbi:Inositol 2-dehydrogenase [Aquisphaera giovannonii]|uniref:Inositol 2-dehydrogenase n=1 Tax=Aquisphaera giovannonii TaxID=406548 RepID=A0A5B9VZV6_9BACT|nr:Gfo/Idh/MocA family oxidoreductase [Aquisphaera giovannonii]QEH33315.1 Inositol 2-dehydrogenase [Aquisphaera giovannonii]